MKTGLLMIVLSVFAISCTAQEAPDDAAMQPMRSLIQQILDASEGCETHHISTWPKTSAPTPTRRR